MTNPTETTTNNKIIVDAYIYEGAKVLNFMTEDVRRMGILRSTREESITLVVENDKIVFDYCWGIHAGCSYNYKSYEVDLFRQDHPNLLETLQHDYDAKTLVYRYRAKDGKECFTTDLNKALAKEN